MLQTNLYDYDLQFSLQFNNTQTLVLEPISLCLEPMNWSKIINRIPRDKKWFGFWTDYIEDKFGLLFSFEEAGGITGGGDFLMNIYETYGDQAEVYFALGYAKSQQIPSYSTGQIIKRWRVNLQEYEKKDGSHRNRFGGIMTSIEKMPFQGKLAARMKTKCAVNAVLNMDGDPLTPISSYTARLHSKTLEETTIFSSPAPITLPESVSTFFDTYLVFQLDQNGSVINELYDVFTQPAGILNTGSRLPASAGVPAPANGSGIYLTGGPSTPLTSALAPPFSTLISQYIPSTSGLLSISVVGGGPNTSWYYYGFASDPGYWTATPRVVVMRLIDGVYQIISETDGVTKIISVGGTPTGNPYPTPPMIGSFPSATNLNTSSTQYILPSVTGFTARADCHQVSGYSVDEELLNIEVLAGDQVFLHIILCPNRTVKTEVSSWIQLDNWFNTITYKQLTIAPPSTAPAYRFFDVINQMLENITGQKNALRSPILEEGGALWNVLTTNGYALRNFNALINQPTMDLESILSSIQAITFIGVGIQEINEIEYMYIDYAPNLMKSLVIDTYLDTLQWEESHDTSYSYNLWQLGYNTWQGLNLIMQDEFNTQGEYLTQFMTYGNNTFNLMSNLIGSGYLLEEQRRNQFLLNPNQSLQNDNDWFIIATSEPNAFHNLAISASNATSRIAFYQTSMALLAGDKFVLSFLPWSNTASYVLGSVVSDGATNYICQSASGNFTSNLPPHLDAVNWHVGGGANAGTIFTIVVESSTFVGEDIYSVTPAPVDELYGAYTVTITPPSPDQVFAERNQPFQICSGVIDPSTIYNGRFSPKHILYEWLPLVCVGLWFFNNSNPNNLTISQIVTTLVKMNSKFTSKFIQSEPFKGNCGTNTLVEFNREFVMTYTQDILPRDLALFSPKVGMCSIRRGWNDFELLRKALSGETGDASKDFGGLALQDSNNEVWFCHVIDLSYDQVKEMINLTVRKVKLLYSISTTDILGYATEQ